MSAEKEGDTLCFFINGKKVTVSHAEPETTLLSFLREELRLTGTKYGCGGGGCGACTVMVSRYQPATKTITHYSANACLLPLCQLHGAAVTTVEGVGSTRTRIHPVQERIAKAHGSQCGFCSPGMVMSIYTLLRNRPQPAMDDITHALQGNLCRCTGYRPIIDGCRTFCQEADCCQANGAGDCCLDGEETLEETQREKPELFDKREFLPLDPTQELIFPPELILWAERAPPQTLTFRGERMMWVSPASLEELVQLKTRNPEAPLVMGNTNIGPDIKFKGVLHPLIISPTRVLDLFEVTQTPHGVWVGAGCSLTEVRSLLEKLLPQFPEEKTEVFRALSQQLGNVGSLQIRNVASLGGNIMSAYPNSDLNPVLAAGNCKVSVISNGGKREVPLNRDFFVSFGKTILKPEEIVVSVFIPFSRKVLNILTLNPVLWIKFQLGLDVSEALRLPGVIDVITAKDVPGQKVRKMFGYEEVLLAETEVSCVGQMICAVVADTRVHARRGAAAVKIGYEDLPEPLFTVEEASEKSSFFEPRRMIEKGNVAEAFKTVDHVHQGEFRMGGQEHFYMETQSMLVVPVGEETEFNAYVSTQWPTGTQDAIAEALGIPSNRVTCHVKRIGGAFGGKVVKTATLACITAVAAWKTNRAVRCVLERGEDMLISGARHPVLGKYKVGFMNDGRIMAADMQYYTNAGNTVDESPLVVEKILLHIDNAYNIPNLRGRGAACRTNLPSNTAFRGFGVPQSIMVLENMLNDVAMVLGHPADQIREINMYQGPSVTHYGLEFSPENLRRCWDQCKGKSDYAARRRAADRFNQDNRWKKRGVAIVPIKYGIAFAESFLNQAAALVHVYKDGSVLVSHGGTEMGQGLHTKMQQVASRELGIPPSKIYISETSTNTVPNTCPSAASYGTDANGMAVRNACQTLYQRLEPIRQKNPKGSWESWVKAAFFDKISLSATGFYRGPDLYMDWDKMAGRPYAYFTFGACFCEVELDCLTGDYRVVRTDIVMDIGRSVNPSMDIGQIEGAFLQGLGLYTLEELKFSPAGLLYTRGPSQYKIPAVCDVPLRFNVYLLPDSHNPHAIYSSKGIGEPALFLGSSVFFAIKDAVAAARSESGLVGPFPLDSPATPERACLACASPFTQKIPASTPGSFKPWALNM
ncbi:aldehyde oxidase 6 [Perca fluviatilis]|uniref:aldehyde oxidase 6 n=1 Tax=Perca fluviatilis TaxID=8168 RepID=UPI001963A517|nr:aldehyde oxidase 6 [Perca fluviatilis]